MADSEPQVIRGIDWKSTFPFTQIFRSFRVAIHPSKLVLALLALLLIYMGGRVLDAVWSNNSRAVPGEMEMYLSSRGDPNHGQGFRTERDRVRKAIVDDYNSQLKAINKPDGDLGDIKWWILDQRRQAVERADKTYDASKETDSERKRALQESHDLAVRQAYDNASDQWQRFKAVEGTGLFEMFFSQELGQAHRVVRNARNGTWVGKGGVFDQIIILLTAGPGWALRYHPLYFTIFFIWFLIIWAIFGGAIARIAAVQVARDEKISFRQALSFSTAKFLSFVSAPIIPILIVMVVGLVVALGGAVTFNIPYIGPVVGGALFFLALAAGFVMTLVLIGLLGGFNLMYPTIAVEGSDSFDAISRSFSYLYARPWRLMFYSLIAAIYGVACYVFVRYFIKLMLALTHCFVGMFVVRHAPDTAALWPTIWPDPLTATRLSYNIDHLRLGPGDDAGAFFVAFWVYLTISMLGAFAISFYFSANTIIYILMRHEVDATELDDVYLEQSEEDFGDMGAGTGAGSAAVTATTVTTTTTVVEPTTPPAPEASAPPPAPEAEQPPPSQE